VAWPPGPINAEILRRGVARGFRPAFAVCLGASTGDFLWAIAVTSGLAALLELPGVRPAMYGVSVALLGFLAARSLLEALAGWRARREGGAPPGPGGSGSARAGFLLGLGMALTSPWNAAFWIGAVGQAAGAGAGLAGPAAFAAAVVAGAMTWGFLFSAAVARGARFAGPRWEIGTRAATGLLLLGFALERALRGPGG